MMNCSQNPFCSSLPDGARRRLCAGCRQRLYKAGSTQLYDDFSKEVTLILDGVIYGTSPVGEDDIGETEFLPLFVLCLPGRPLSLDATFRDGSSFNSIPHGFNEVLCLTDCRIASFNHSLVRSLFESDRAFAAALMESATGLMMDISQVSAITRASSTYIATCLLMQKLVEFGLYLSQVDVALVLGCNRSSVARAIARIQDKHAGLYKAYRANKGRPVAFYKGWHLNTTQGDRGRFVLEPGSMLANLASAEGNALRDGHFFSVYETLHAASAIERYLTKHA